MTAALDSTVTISRDLLEEIASDFRYAILHQHKILEVAREIANDDTAEALLISIHKFNRDLDALNHRLDDLVEV